MLLNYKYTYIPIIYSALTIQATNLSIEICCLYKITGFWNESLRAVYVESCLSLELLILRVDYIDTQTPSQGQC